MTEQCTTEFQGFFAEFYDMLHAGCGDQAIYPELLKPYGRRVLELGCGTGRVAIPLAEASYDVTGIEAEPDMLARLEQKQYPRERLKIVQADARSFHLESQFDAILLSCNFMNHFVEAADALAVLERCREHLAPEGVIVMDCSTPDVRFMAKTHGQEEAFTFPTSRGTVIKDYFLARYDFVRQVEEDRIILEEYQGDTLIRRAETHETLTWYFPREIRLLARTAGLRVQKEAARLGVDTPACTLEDASPQLVFFLTCSQAGTAGPSPCTQG